jgi:hypothetical protein
MKQPVEDQRKVKCRKKCRKGTKSAGVTCVTKQAVVEMNLAENIKSMRSENDKKIALFKESRKKRR